MLTAKEFIEVLDNTNSTVELLVIYSEIEDIKDKKKKIEFLLLMHQKVTETLKLYQKK